MAASIETKKKQQYKKLQRNCATNILRNYALKHPWLNKKLIFNHIDAEDNIEKSNDSVPPKSSPYQETNISDDEDSTNITCSKRGRPKVITLKRKSHMEFATTAVFNTVVSNFMIEIEERKHNQSRKNLRKGHLNEIIIAAGKQHNLPESFTVNSQKLYSRARCSQDFFSNDEIHGGHISPPSKTEPYFCDMLITLSKIRLDLNPTEYIELINALIKGTPHNLF